jgi:hypothetical protein
MRVNSTLKEILDSQKQKGESDADCIIRLIRTNGTPPPTHYLEPNKQSIQPASKSVETRPAWVDEMKKEIVRDVKNIIESVMAR